MTAVALLLPGQGSQYPGMATGLYGLDEVFTAAMDEVFRALGREGARLRDDWLSPDPILPLDHVKRSQPLLFAIGYAFGRRVLAWGVRPVALLGHSIGEMAAAALAGIFTLEESARLVWHRVSTLDGAPPGGMLAVAAPPAALEPYLGGQVSVGAVNAPRQTVLAGSRTGLAEVAADLRERGIVHQAVATLTPFHSPVLEYAVPVFEREYARVERRPPRLTIYSCYTAGVLDPTTAADPGYWARHPVDPVRFWPALDALTSSGVDLLLESGPGRSLTTLARRHPAVRAGRCHVLPMTPDPGMTDLDALTRARTSAL